jgi:hypothetical protein
MIALADDVLCRRGRLVDACRQMGPATESMSGPLVRLSPLAFSHRSIGEVAMAAAPI